MYKYLFAYFHLVYVGDRILKFLKEINLYTKNIVR